MAADRIVINKSKALGSRIVAMAEAIATIRNNVKEYNGCANHGVAAGDYTVFINDFGCSTGDAPSLASAPAGKWEGRNFERFPIFPYVDSAKVANVRLTLESGVPISTTSQSNKKTFYATPYYGNFLPIWNGSSWQDIEFSELTFPSTYVPGSLTGNVTSGSAVVTNISDTSELVVGQEFGDGTYLVSATTITSIDSSSQIHVSTNATGTASGVSFAVNLYGTNTSPTAFDVFCFDSGAGVPKLCVSKPWASTTARTDAISKKNGVYVNTNDLTGRLTAISANKATYLGTITKAVIGGFGFSDSFSERDVWNYFNRKLRPMYAIDANDTWNYSTAAYRQANAASQNQLNFVRGLDEDEAMANVFASVVSSGATARLCKAGIGLDSYTVNSAVVFDGRGVTTARADLKAAYVGYPGLGYHYLAWLEYGGGVDTQTWTGDRGGDAQCGIYGSVWC